MTGDTWSQSQLDEFRRLDLDVARTIRSYEGTRGFEKVVFVPTRENLSALKADVQAKLDEAKALKDEFWRSHFVAVLESFLFKLKCDTMLPYAFMSRNSNVLNSIVKETSEPADERLATIAARFEKLPALVRALASLATTCPEAGHSQLATTMKSFVDDMKAAAEHVNGSSAANSLKAVVSGKLAEALGAVSELATLVKEIPVSQLEAVSIPFEESVIQGMQAPLDYILEWVDDDVEMRRKIFFDTAREIEPERDPYDLLNFGSETYSTAESLLKGMEDLLAHMQRDARNYVDLPEGETCEVIPTPDAYKMVCPTAMYMSSGINERELKGYVCLNTDNLSAFSRGSLEETVAHEVYPGHHAHFVITATRKLPHTFSLDLPMGRCIIEGLAHRSEYLMIPHYVDRISRLDSARRGWYCSSRVKAEVDLYLKRRPTREILDNYVKRLNCTAYSANGQMQAHLAYPADAICYYTGMRILEDIYRNSGVSQKEFTNESFRYGNVAMGTIRDILSLPAAKRDALGIFQQEPLGGA